MVLPAVLPHDGPTVTVPVPDAGDLAERDGIEAKAVVLDQLATALTGHGDADVLALLPATVPAARVAQVGLHAWEPDAYAHVGEWGLPGFGPGQLWTSLAPLLDGLAGTGCSKVAIHFDVDVVDSNEIVLGLGAEPDGLTSAQVRRIVADVQGAADVVGLTIAEFIPRQVIGLQQILAGMPLL